MSPRQALTLAAPMLGNKHDDNSQVPKSYLCSCTDERAICIADLGKSSIFDNRSWIGDWLRSHADMGWLHEHMSICRASPKP